MFIALCGTSGSIRREVLILDSLQSRIDSKSNESRTEKDDETTQYYHVEFREGIISLSSIVFFFDLNSVFEFY